MRGYLGLILGLVGVLEGVVAARKREIRVGEWKRAKQKDKNFGQVPTFSALNGKFLILPGAIFPESYTLPEIAFRSALRRANSHPEKFELVPVIKYVSETDSFKTQIAGN